MSINRKEMLLKWIPRIFLLVIMMMTISPLIFVILTSLKTTQQFLMNIWAIPTVLQWENYSIAWIDAEIRSYYLNSIYVVSVTISGILLFASLAGYALARLNIPKAELMMVIILIPQMFPSESILMPFYIMMSKLKLLGNAYTLIIPFVGWGVPIATYIFRNFFSSIQSELIEAAKVDGANDLKVFRVIIVPLMLPAILTVAIFNFVWWGELFWTSVSLSASPFRTIPLGILSFQTQMGTDWGPLSAAICLVMVPLIAIFLAMQKYFVQGLTAGGVKG